MLEQIEEKKKAKEDEIVRKKAEAKAQRASVKEVPVESGEDAMEEDDLLDDAEMIGDDDIGSVSFEGSNAIHRVLTLLLVWCKPNGCASGLCESSRCRIPRSRRSRRNGRGW